MKLVAVVLETQTTIYILYFYTYFDFSFLEQLLSV